MRHSISYKIFSIALLIITLMGLVTGISSYYLDKVSDEAIELAHYYIPIEQKIQWAARHSNAELVHFERHLALRRSGAEAVRIKAELNDMLKRSAQAETVIDEALALVRKGQGDTSIDIRSRDFDRMEIELPQIITAHRQMRATIENYLRATTADAAGATNLPQLLFMEEQLAQQRAAVGKEIGDVADLLERLTKDSADTALALEQRARQLTLGVTIAAVLISLVLAALITQSLVRPVRDLVAGTQAIRSGNLDARVAVSSTDEIATLADSFNHMAGGLKQKEVIQNTFGKYVDPRIVKNLIENDGLTQAGDKRRMTVFFSDIEGFTALSEKLQPERLVAFLNRYFALMADVVRQEHGIIDKYIGDAIMAFWGPPFVGEHEHAAQACRTAVMQLRKLDELRAALPSLVGELPHGAPRLNIRIGITTGDVTVGSIGSETQRNYTVIGDTVNLASRLESVNKLYGTGIIVSEASWIEARGVIDSRELDRIRVVGKDDPVRIFEVLGLQGESDAATREWCAAFEAALAELRAGNVGAAHAGFSACLAMRGHDGASRLYLERIKLIEATGLPDGWDGVWTLTHK